MQGNVNSSTNDTFLGNIVNMYMYTFFEKVIKYIAYIKLYTNSSASSNTRHVSRKCVKAAR